MLQNSFATSGRRLGHIAQILAYQTDLKFQSSIVTGRCASEFGRSTPGSKQGTPTMCISADQVGVSGLRVDQQEA